jgi:hypothetical protein
MHAVVVTASIAAGELESSRKRLREEIVPRVSKMQGVVKGYWTASADSAHGTSMVVFKTKEDAESAAKTVRDIPPPPGVTLNTIEVREVVAET